jgi:hypothetical protein
LTEQQGQNVIALLERILASITPQDHRSDSTALETALLIEDYFAQHHVGGRMQRLAKVQCAIKRAIDCSQTRRTPDDTDVMHDDLREMLQSLGMDDGAQPRSPHEVFQTALTEMKRQLSERRQSR